MRHLLVILFMLGTLVSKSQVIIDAEKFVGFPFSAYFKWDSTLKNWTLDTVKVKKLYVDSSQKLSPSTFFGVPAVGTNETFPGIYFPYSFKQNLDGFITEFQSTPLLFGKEFIVSKLDSGITINLSAQIPSTSSGTSVAYTAGSATVAAATDLLVINGGTGVLITLPALTAASKVLTVNNTLAGSITISMTASSGAKTSLTLQGKRQAVFHWTAGSWKLLSLVTLLN